MSMTGIHPLKGATDAQVEAAIAAAMTRAALPPWVVGNYYDAGSSLGGTPSTATLTVGADYFIPFEVPTDGPHSIDRIGPDITVVGSAGSVMRLGLVLPGPDGKPLTLVEDYGEIDTASGTGIDPITINPVEVLENGGRYYAVVNVGVASPTLRTLIGMAGVAGMTTSFASQGVWFQTRAYAPFPATFAPTGITATVPRIAVRAA